MSERPKRPASPAIVKRLRAKLRQARRAAHASESRFHAIIDRAADGIVIIDRCGDMRYINPAAERLFDRAGAELIGQPFGFAVLAGETAEIDLVLRESTSLVVEMRASETTWNGEPAQIVSLRDITDRRNAEERAHRLELAQTAHAQAQRSSERWRFLADAGEALDASLDPGATLAGLARLIVPRAAEWCVIDAQDEGGRLRRVVGKHADPARQPLLDAVMQAAPADDAGRPVMRVLTSRVAELHSSVSRRELHAWAGEMGDAELHRLGMRSLMIVPMLARADCLGVITFVCESREYDENDLALAREVAARAGRALENAQLHEAALAANQAKSDFLTVMSHELRTPLNAVLGYAQLLDDGVIGSVENALREPIRRIRASAAHLLEIINDILVFSSLEAARGQIVSREADLRAVVREVVGAAEPLLREKGLELRVCLPESAAPVFTDADKIRQIGLHLLTNAAKFTEQGHVEVRAGVEAGQLVIAVTDTGRGISAAQMQRIFEPFWQAEGPLTRRAGGTGLGLAISSRLARLLGGRIEVASEPGCGSTFVLRVPSHIGEHPS